VVCPLCGGPNDCVSARSGNFDAPCWCTEVTVNPAALARLPEHERNKTCLCWNCVK
jgi:hypothetical protein